MRVLNALAGAVFAAAFMLAGTGNSFAASAVTHPAPIIAGKAAKVEGAIVVAKKGKKGAIVGGIIAGAIGAAIIANEAAKANERRRRRDYDDGYDDRPRRRSRRRASEDAYERCADQFKSFRYSDGTYQPYDSDRRELCPYL